MPEIRDCVVLAGEELMPRRCHRLVWDSHIEVMELGEPVDEAKDGSLVLLPGWINGHTHIGDSILPDGSIGLTLEAAFFRPDGLKYRELAKATELEISTSMQHMHEVMLGSGTVCHVDFREQGVAGAQRLRSVSESTGVSAVILSQLDRSPFDTDTLNANEKQLPSFSLDELREILTVADGFSESTMNDLTDPAWEQVQAETRSAGRLRAIHCLESEDYRNTSIGRTGKGDLERALDLYQPHLVVHMTVANSSEIERVAAAGIPVVINPRANAALGLPLPPVAEMMRAGVRLLLGTDNVMLNSPSLFAELDFTWKVAKSQGGDPVFPEPLELLKMVTVHGRGVVPGYSGILETGEPATFFGLDFSQPPLLGSRNIAAAIVGRATPQQVAFTLVNGSMRYEGQPNFKEVFA